MWLAALMFAGFLWCEGGESCFQQGIQNLTERNDAAAARSFGWLRRVT